MKLQIILRILQFFGAIGGDERVNDLVEPSVKDAFERIEREADPVVG